MAEHELVEKVARAMWEDYMIDPQHNGAEMPTWEMLLAGTDRPIEFPEFVNMHRQAMSQARAALSVIREALSEPSLQAEVDRLRVALARIEHECIIRRPATAVQTVKDVRAIAREAIALNYCAASPTGEK